MLEKTLEAPAIRTRRNVLMFLIPSLIGILLFMTPVIYDGNVTIPVAVLAKLVQTVFADHLVAMVSAIITTTMLMTLIAWLFKPAILVKRPFLNSLFNVSPFWACVRVLGGVFVLLTFFEAGPEVLRSGATGGLVLHDLLPVLFSVFIFAGLLLPLLLDFGLLEFVGTMMTRIMRPVFRLPGRSAVDCFASWLGDGSVGILLTSKQYEGKFYTQREAAVIGTTFSAVSITFCLVVISQVKLEHMFVPFYLTVCLAGVVAAIVVPRLPPLSWKKDVYSDGTPLCRKQEAIPHQHSVLSYGYHRALTKADSMTDLGAVAREGVKNALDMVFGVLPVVMAIGTCALMLAEHTSIFNWLGAPFVPLLELLQLPEAEAASKTIMVGFADMFIPAVLASTIESDITRFVIAAMSVTQLIYMSEVGALLLGSKIPVKLWELFVIFLLRTLVTLPVIAGVAHLLF
ncbi:YjiH family protein [Aeromonas caviae]|uniref:YjiH family protein n=1 Tax=Aeromonas TaxID=642 RepID=UPI001905F3A1|nr:YjiH family protein [Aeromonas caviae]MBP8079064.1 YjiH family protein [Aeromonas sp.]MCR6553505.1 YjiH family protein [Aeromonas sp. CPF2-S1]QQM76604.1 YjiH family protein [Aeromonas caviae]QQV21069.1 YjiH family protein [Aeromonas caviae]